MRFEDIEEELCAKLEKKDKEIERLNEELKQAKEIASNEHKYASEMEDKYIIANNIINELEKMMKNELECACSMNENGLFNGAIDMLEVYLGKLQELKGSDK